MKYIKGFFHSLYLSYVARFGGKIEGGEWFILWTIHFGQNVSVGFKDMNFMVLRDLEWAFCMHGGDLTVDGKAVTTHAWINTKKGDGNENN